MLKYIHLFKNYYLGVSVIGIIAFVIQLCFLQPLPRRPFYEGNL